MQIAPRKMRGPANPAQGTGKKCSDAEQDAPLRGEQMHRFGQDARAGSVPDGWNRKAMTAAMSRSQNGVRMEIQTTRFGQLTVEDERIMSLPSGLLGFPNQNRFALIQTGTENYFFWLQSVDDPNLAFVVTDPTIFFKDYDVPVREETQQELKVTDPSFLQVFVICNKVGEWLTGNLLGPIVVNAENRLAQQVVLTEKKWTTRQPLLRLATDVPLAKSA
jgi:flagellar assembly factor FliW